MSRLPTILLALATVLVAEGAPRVILQRGLVVDGSGNPPRIADVEILPSGHIGSVDPAGAPVIPATGLVIAPGFIDVHSPAKNITKRPGATNFLRMGVTTLILGSCGVPHPRGYGNNARLVARHVRGQRTISLAEAVRRMTSLPARTFQLKDRGKIHTGAWADHVAFDPLTVRDNATFAAPHAYATGFRHVFVNGVPVIKNDPHVGSRPGRILRLNP